ncbi:MAG: putative TetR-family transcriptional regulator [Pseudonocardiales bacterium]|nr:putative TetR-family transcriptional regulator [Pseudonocardiales bacterium]
MAEPSNSRLFETTSAQRRQSSALTIERTAMDLFVADGLEGVTVARIASAAGVSVRSFYRYFGSKEDILLALPIRRAESIAEATLLRPPHESPYEAMRAGISELSGPDDLSLRKWQQAVAAGQASDRMSQQVVAVTSPILIRALATRAGTDHNDLWVEVAGVLIATALVAGARRWARTRGPLREDILSAVDMVGRGLAVSYRDRRLGGAASS